MNHAAVLLMVSALFASPADNGLGEYEYVRTLRLRGTPGAAAAIMVDTLLYRAANDDFSNLRILDGNGAVVPFAVRDARPSEMRTSYLDLPGKITDFSRDIQQNTAAIEFTLDEPGVVSRLVFPADSGKFDKRVAVEFFDRNGKKTGERRDLALRQYGKLFGSAAVDFAPAEAAKLRIVIDRYAERKESEFVTEAKGTRDRVAVRNVRNEEYPLEKIVVCRAVAESVPGKVKVSKVELPEIAREEKDRATVITVDARKVPCTGLEILADDGNYSRTVEIFSVSGRGEKLLKVAEATPKKRKISLPERRGERYVVKVRNEDDPPLKNLRLEWTAKEKILVIVPPPGGDLKLYYGGKAAKRSYDIEKYADRFGLPPCIYEAGEETVSPDYAPAVSSEEIFRYLMWTVLAVAAAVLLTIVIRMLGKDRPAAS